jgi:cyclophilin family peptidyl-prolyl cis-trans isomerase
MGGRSAEERYKPGFPMNLLQHQKAFWIVGAAVMVVSLLGAYLLQSQDPGRSAAAASTPTATSTPTPDPNATPTPTPDPNATPTATPPPKTFSKADQVIDASAKKYTATLKTDKGDIVMNLLADKAPRTVNTFVFLVQNKFYDGITFHRIVKNFVAQAGDPTGTGSGGPGFQTEEDQNDLKNTRGMVSMAKAGAVTNFGSQLFINLQDNPSLDSDGPNQKRFYPWAQVTPESMAVVDKLVQGDVIRSATITESPK